MRQYGDAVEWESLVNHGNVIPWEQFSARTIQKREVAFYTLDDLRKMDSSVAKAMYASGILSVSSVPLVAGNRVWEALNANDKTGNAFRLAEVEYLQQVANQIAAALQNAHAYVEIARLSAAFPPELRSLPSSSARSSSWSATASCV